MATPDFLFLDYFLNLRSCLIRSVFKVPLPRLSQIVCLLICLCVEAFLRIDLAALEVLRRFYGFCPGPGSGFGTGAQHFFVFSVLR